MYRLLDPKLQDVPVASLLAAVSNASDSVDPLDSLGRAFVSRIIGGEEEGRGSGHQSEQVGARR